MKLRELERIRNIVADAKEMLKWAERDLATAEKQFACEHKSLDSRGVFGTTCNDCNYFFNDGM